MTPEEKARQKIDEQLLEAGWLVLDRKDFSAGLPAVALRETLLKGNLEADYMLFLNGIAVGVIEAKREEIDPSGYNVCEQAATYTRKVPNTYKKIGDFAFYKSKNITDVCFENESGPRRKSVEGKARIVTPEEFENLFLKK